jgi:phosphohistidine phosphatase
MSLRLIVMRHAKSDWSTDAPGDHDRPLNARGRRDAPRVAKRLVKLGWKPALVLSSDSRRTRETLELMLDRLTPIPQVQYLASLYQGGQRELAESVATLDSEISPVLVLGHNPGWEGCLEWLTGQYVRLTTANAALCRCGAEDWASAMETRGAWKLVDVIRPKEL